MTALHAHETTVGIRKATAGEVTQIGRTLGRAFFDDQTMRWMIPDDDRRRRALPAFFELFASTILRQDEVYLAGDGIGAALWVPPGTQVVDEDHAEEFAERVGQISGR